MNHYESGLELLKVLEQSNNECSRNGIIFLRICYHSRKRNGISLTVSAQISPYVDLTQVIKLVERSMHACLPL